MKTYVALLRGVNVSGQKKIRMADLKTHLEEFGWERIRTYIQSGNIVFKSAAENPVHLAQKIRQKLQDIYGFDVPTLVMDSHALMQIINNNPFIRDPATDQHRCYVVFLFEKPRADLVSKVQETKQPNENFIFEDKTIYLHYPDGYGRAVMDNNAFEKGLKVEATTRNWMTINKLHEMTKQ